MELLIMLSTLINKLTNFVYENFKLFCDFVFAWNFLDERKTDCLRVCLCFLLLIFLCNFIYYLINNSNGIIVL